MFFFRGGEGLFFLWAIFLGKVDIPSHKNSYKPNYGPIRSFAVKENHIGQLAVSDKQKSFLE